MRIRRATIGAALVLVLATGGARYVVITPRPRHRGMFSILGQRFGDEYEQSAAAAEAQYREGGYPQAIEAPRSIDERRF